MFCPDELICAERDEQIDLERAHGVHAYPDICRATQQPRRKIYCRSIRSANPVNWNEFLTTPVMTN